jgi:hypothetical protein
MTRYARPYTSAQRAAVKSGRPGPARAGAKRCTTAKAELEHGCSTLTRWWASATHVTTSSDVTQRWRMTVDGC